LSQRDKYKGIPIEEMKGNNLMEEKNITGGGKHSYILPIYFNQELKLLEDWLAKPEVGDGYPMEEIEDIEVMDLPLAYPVFLNKCECMLIGNEQGIVFKDNNKILRKKSLQENKVDEDHAKIAYPFSKRISSKEHQVGIRILQPSRTLI